MRRAISVLVALPFLLAAQVATTPTLSLTQATAGAIRYWPASTPPTVLTLTLANSSGQNLAAVEWTITGIPAGSTVSEATGAASTAAGKTVTCAPVSSAGDLLCVAAGLNQTVYADGVVATISLGLPTTATPGTLSLTTANALSATASATAVTTSAGPILPLTVLNPCDLTGDGSINAADLTSAIQQVLGIASCSTADLVGSGACTGQNGLTDLLRVIGAALGGSCKVGP